METLQEINRRLREIYGELDNKPHFRVVWSEDQFEKALITQTPEGLQLLTPEVKEVPKYRIYIKDKYILESLTVIPEMNQHELPTEKLSYEPIWVFEDKHGNPLRPAYGACRLVCETVMGNIANAGVYTKYKENNEAVLEKKQRELDEITQELYGNETDIGDALAHDSGVGFTTSKVKEH